LFARIDEQGKLQLVNHLGIDLGHTPEQILSKLDDERIKDEDVLWVILATGRGRSESLLCWLALFADGTHRAPDGGVHAGFDKNR
ncbi:hypothetical protein MJO10_31610, partial [Salmonella enterica subsp. enterica serovar Anatum]|nr:hypothetical protein [Salmonella enterica subsp. enterica serovar Anatum]